MAIIRVKPGVVNASDGAYAELRGGRSGELLASLAHGTYQEAVKSGNVFVAASTVATTVPAGLSASPTTPTLYNPVGSGKYLVLWYAGLTNLIAFTAASAVWLGVSDNLSAAAVTGTPLTPANALLGSKTSPSGLVFTTATLPAAPTKVCATLGAGLTGAITTVPTTSPLSRWFDGSIVIAPGAALSFQASTIGPASGSFGELIWEEVTP